MPFKNSSGGFSFLSLLKKELSNHFQIVDDVNLARVIMLNANPNSLGIVFLSKLFILSMYKRLAILLRMDGLLSTYRKDGKFYDKFVFPILIKLATEVVWQSEFSKSQFEQRSGAVIHNFVDPVFSKNVSAGQRENAYLFSSHSANDKKGFHLLEILAKKYEKIQFYNCSPRFLDLPNVKNFGILSKQDLSKLLKKTEFYLFLAENESCSNALIEAIESKCKVIALNSGSNGEILGLANVYSAVDLIMDLERISKNHLATNKSLKSRNYVIEAYKDILSGLPIKIRVRTTFFLGILVAILSIYKLQKFVFTKD